MFKRSSKSLTQIRSGAVFKKHFFKLKETLRSLISRYRMLSALQFSFNTLFIYLIFVIMKIKLYKYWRETKSRNVHRSGQIFLFFIFYIWNVPWSGIEVSQTRGIGIKTNKALVQPAGRLAFVPAPLFSRPPFMSKGWPKQSSILFIKSAVKIHNHSREGFVKYDQRGRELLFLFYCHSNPSCHDDDDALPN